MTKKPMPKRTKGLFWALGIIAVALVVWAGIEYKRNSPIQSLSVLVAETEDNLRFIEESDVRNILFNAFGHYLEGQVVRRVDLQEVETVLERVPHILNADVYLDAWNNVKIAIVQRRPVVRVMDVLDESYYLDEKGFKMPLSPKYTARVPVLSGEIGVFVENFLEVEDSRLRKGFELIQKIRANDFLNRQIEQVHLDREEDAILVPKLGDHRIIFGAPEMDVQDKFERLEAFYRYGLSREGWEEYRSLNLSYRGQLVAKRRL